MDPFRIVCPACSTKLVVRQPELVGRTVPCPKCKNAIHVVRAGQVAWNPGTVAAGDLSSSESSEPKKANPPANPPANPQAKAPQKPTSSVNSEAITKADPGDWDLEAFESALAEQNAPSGDLAQGGFFRDSTADTSPSRKKETEPFAIQPLDPPSSSVGSTTVPAAAWQSPQAKTRRQLLTLIVVGISGCVLAALAFVAFLNYVKSNRDQPKIQNNPPAAAIQPADPNLQKAQAPKPDEPANPQEIARQPELEKPPELTIEAAPGVNRIEPMVPADPKEPTAAQAPGLKFNPPAPPPENSIPEKDPTQIGIPPIDQPPPIDQTPPIDEPLPSIFKDFLPIFDRSSQPGWSDLGKEGDKTIDQELSIENSEVAFSREYYPQPIPLPNWTERSERKFGRIRTPEMTLLSFVHWLNRITGHAISIDWFLFNLSDVGLDTPFKLESEGTSGEEILKQFTAQIGAQVDIDPQGFVFIRPLAEKLSNKLKPDGTTSLGTLDKGLPEGQDQSILRLVLDLLQVDGCEYNEGKLSWGPDATAYQQAQVLAALASIREAIAIAGPGDNQAGENQVFDFNRPEAWMSLLRKSQMKLPKEQILYEERPILDIMIKAAQASQCELLIDWPAVWSHGLHPNRMALSLLRGRTMLEVANRFLEDHSLELVPLDSRTWMLTTEGQRRSMIRLLAVRTDRGVSLEDMRVSLRGLVPRSANGKSLFRSEVVPGAPGVALLRICPPNSNLLGDEELVGALGPKAR